MLEIDESPWDVYLLFDRNADWKDQAPKPILLDGSIGSGEGDAI